ncbi:MAG: hypothetical protein PHY90_01800 [Desulfitobacteriaceae bacterium]|nr:hypothetical protein [Desulfitobacteriaceae bacterium]
MEKNNQRLVQAERGNKEVDQDIFRQYIDYGAITQKMAKQNKEQERRQKNPQTKP